MKHIAKIMLVAAMLFAAKGALALGVGGYVDFGAGSADIDVEDVDENWKPDITSNWGAGITLDTAPMTTDLFSYRLDFGYEAMTLDDDSDDESEKMDFQGVSIDNTFAFTIMSNADMRFWIGPTIKLGYISDNEGSEYPDISMYTFGIGAALGANFPVGNNIIISPVIGARYSGISGTAEMDDVDIDLTGTATQYYIRLNVLYGI